MRFVPKWSTSYPQYHSVLSFTLSVLVQTKLIYFYHGSMTSFLFGGELFTSLIVFGIVTKSAVTFSEKCFCGE